MYGAQSCIVGKVGHEKNRQEKNQLVPALLLEKSPGHYLDSKGDNKQVPERIKPDVSLEGKITKFHLIYFGHVMFSNSLEKALMLRTVRDKRKQGCQKTRWVLSRSTPGRA